MVQATYEWAYSLGSGSSNHITVVREGIEIDQNNLVVLKTPKPDTTGINRAKLSQEARILAALRHPYIVVYVAQITRPTPGILVRYCAGASLRDRVRWHQVHGIAMSEGLIRRVLRHTLLALHHLHTAHGDRLVIVHRAISPEKLLFDRDNNVILAGFGHASYHPPRGQFLQGNIANETYPAPEMRLGRRYGPLVDIYALGCIVHECCTLRLVIERPQPSPSLWPRKDDHSVAFRST